MGRVRGMAAGSRIATLVLLVSVAAAQDNVYMGQEYRSIDLTTRYFDGCKPACGWTGNFGKEIAPGFGPVRGCGPVKPDGTQDRVPDGAYSACSDGGTSYACLDTSAFTEDGQRYAFAAISLDTTGGPYSCCECYEATFSEGPMAGQSLQVQMINNGGFVNRPLMDLHVVGAGKGDNNVVSVDNSALDPAPYGGGLGKTGADSPPLFSAEDWGDQSGLWGRRFSRYNPPNDVSYAGGIASVCGDQTSCFEACDDLPWPGREMCKWEFADDGFRGASIPPATLRRIACPAALYSRSGCLLREDQDFLTSAPPAVDDDEEDQSSGEQPVEGGGGGEEGCEDEIWATNGATGESERYTCEDYARWGFCDEDWMRGWCRKTCGTCGGECSDEIWEVNSSTGQPEEHTCEDYARWDLCGEDWMKGWCDASCGRCEQQVEVPAPDVEGCTDAGADNYDQAANVDDGSCVFCDAATEVFEDGECTCRPGFGDFGSGCVAEVSGCMNPDAGNFDSQANVDDGSCVYCDWPEVPSAGGACELAPVEARIASLEERVAKIEGLLP